MHCSHKQWLQCIRPSLQMHVRLSWIGVKPIQSPFRKADTEVYRMRLCAVGDNVADCYLDDGVYYPGGNSVNVAVNCKRNGCEAVNYIGVFGNDEKADHIRQCIEAEGVTTFRSRKVYAPSGQPSVRLVDGDRVFGAGVRDSCQHLFSIHITKEDIEVIRQYDVIHSSCYSNIEYELPVLSSILDVAFDYSDRKDESYIARTAPYVSYAFFSGSELDDDGCRMLIDKVHSYGTGIVGITLGSRGAVFSDGEEILFQETKKVDAVDTMGAGDSFIAGFLTSYVESRNLKEALDFAADCAARTCLVHGGWGHPHPL